MDRFLSVQKRCLKLLFSRNFKLLIKCGLHRLDHHCEMITQNMFEENQKSNYWLSNKSNGPNEPHTCTNFQYAKLTFCEGDYVIHCTSKKY